MVTPILDQPTASLHHIAKRLAKPLARLGIATVGDLLLHLPTRHEDLREVTQIRDVRVGTRVVLNGRVILIANRRSFRRRLALTEALVADDTGSIRCVWFQQPYLTHVFPIGTPVALAGTVVADTYGLQLGSPLIESLRSGGLHTGRIVPVYPATAGCSQKQLRFLIHLALPATRGIPEVLPPAVRDREGFLPRGAAIRELHEPSSPESLAAARSQLAFEEVFTHLLSIRASREELDAAIAPRITIDSKTTHAFLAELPFTLTTAQQRAVEEVLGDLVGRWEPPVTQSAASNEADVACSSGEVGERGASKRPRRREGAHLGEPGGSPRYTCPMHRLLNGDVGSGKTVVAAIAAAHVARAGFQVAYLAPTELLARQQAQTFTRWLQPLGISVALWTAEDQRVNGESVTPRAVSAATMEGNAAVVIGTHALLADRVSFHQLGFAVIDEQHRFGVAQRAALRAKASDGQLPHLLSMTATPIPRTLALTLLGDLAVSTLDERPRGRAPATTTVVESSLLPELVRAVRSEIAEGRQAYVVCPAIDGGDVADGETGKGSDVATATEIADRVRRAWPDVRVGLLHGRLRREEQRTVMASFRDREVDILVATTVVEVGVDHPNATVMVIEDAERFGLAQLHQLRGRVGRGEISGRCFLVTRSENIQALDRLRAFATCTDGFALAEIDLKERGPGAMVGAAQSGWPAFRYATMDPALFARVRDAVDAPDVAECRAHAGAVHHLE